MPRPDCRVGAVFLVAPVLWACAAGSRGPAMASYAAADAPYPSRGGFQPAAAPQSGGREEGGGTAAPPPPPPPPTEKNVPAPAATPVARQVIYTAAFTVLVGNAEETTNTFLKHVVDLGGHLQSQQGTTVTVRVPAARFEDATREVAGLGRVLNRRLDAQDVTQAWADLRLRIENAEKARQRLLALLDRAQKMEEIIVLEKELRRLTEEIETMRAQLRGMDDQIAFSTLTVEFRSNAPEVYSRPNREYSPFAWINQVGAEHALGR